MPYSKQHFNEKSRMAKKNSRKGRPCPFTICRFQSIHPENVVKRHLETFGRYESELESGSDDERNIDHQLQETLARIYMTLQVRKQMKEKGNVVELNNRLVIL